MLFSFNKKPTRIYLDYAAATPVSPAVMKAMQPYFRQFFANPSAIHEEGQIAQRAVETARLDVARTLGVRPEGVTWTASGTEANNLAIYGYLRALTESKGRNFSDIEIISTAIEHPSILEVLFHLESHGVKVHFVPVTESGRIDQAAFVDLLNDKTVLVSFAYANSEIGVIEDVRKISRLVQKFNAENGTDIKIHLDAAQAPLWLPCQLEKLGVDMLTLDAGKCYGPKGVGVLARKHGVELKGFVLGGGQENGLRAGTENTPLIVGAAKAIIDVQANYAERTRKVAKLRDYFLEQLTERIEKVEVNGSMEDRIANNVNISIPGMDAEFAVISLDVQGIACSTRSACGSNKTEADENPDPSGLLKLSGSHVVKTITSDSERATSAIRFSLGEQTTKNEIDLAVRVLKNHLKQAEV